MWYCADVNSGALRLGWVAVRLGWGLAGLDRIGRVGLRLRWMFGWFCDHLCNVPVHVVTRNAKSSRQIICAQLGCRNLDRAECRSRLGGVWLGGPSLLLYGVSGNGSAPDPRSEGGPHGKFPLRSQTRSSLCRIQSGSADLDLNLGSPIHAEHHL